VLDPVRGERQHSAHPSRGRVSVSPVRGHGEIAPDTWLTPDEVLEKARRVLAPYTLDVRETAWFSVYRVGHTVTGKFDDVRRRM
jgi:phenol 2-monooxygenase (NADPH)